MVARTEERSSSVERSTLNGLGREEILSHHFDAIESGNLLDDLRHILKNKMAAETRVFVSEMDGLMAVATSYVDKERSIRRRGRGIYERPRRVVQEREISKPVAALGRCHGQLCSLHVCRVIGQPFEYCLIGVEGLLKRGLPWVGDVLVAGLCKESRGSLDGRTHDVEPDRELRIDDLGEERLSVPMTGQCISALFCQDPGRLVSCELFNPGPSD